MQNMRAGGFSGRASRVDHALVAGGAAEEGVVDFRLRFADEHVARDGDPIGAEIRTGGVTKHRNSPRDFGDWGELIQQQPEPVAGRGLY